MISKRAAVLALLTAVPLLVYLGLGAYALWRTNLFVETFWILPVCWGLTWLTATLWKPPGIKSEDDPQTSAHFTPRDQAAQAIIREYQRRVDDYTPEELVDPHFYLTQAQSLARDLAAHYHPRATDPIDSVTVPEVLAAVRLAVEDLEHWMLEAVPGSQVVTIGQWKWLRHAPKWTQRIQNAAWAAGVLVNPVNIARYFLSRMTMGPVTRELQTEFLAAVYLRFIRQTGFYLIEMNSGRLRGGADRYRRTFPMREEPPSRAEEETPTPESLTVALVGQVKAGKSSLVNALIGDKVARTDVLPETTEVARYRLDIEDSAVALTLLDTPGYADSGATKRQMDQLRRAVCDADVVVLTLDAHSPARDADRQVLDHLREWYESHPELKPAPVIACLTHMDLLSPMLEWSPPYDWRQPKTKKERSIHDAVEHVRELFGATVQEVVPVCADPQRGGEGIVRQELLPVLVHVLPLEQTSALLRAYHRDLQSGHWKTVLKQLGTGGKELLKTWVQERLTDSENRS